MRILVTLIIFSTCIFSANAQVTDDVISEIDPSLLSAGSATLIDGEVTIEIDDTVDSNWNFVSPFKPGRPTAREPIKEGTLYYDAPTGEIFIDAVWPNSDRFLGYALWSAQERFIPDNYLRLGGSPDLFFLKEKGITEAAAFSDGFDNGLYQLGPVYPANVSEEDFLADVSTQWGNVLNHSFNVEFARPDGVPMNDPNLIRIQDAWAQTATLSYIAPTGELILDTSGADGGFTTKFSFVLDQDSSEEVILDAAINPKSGNAFTVRPDAIAGIGLLPPGEYNLGAVLSPDLSAEEFISVVAGSRFAGAAGVGSTDFDLLTGGGISAEMSLAYVPEPSAKVSLIVGVLLLGMVRRRFR